MYLFPILHNGIIYSMIFNMGRSTFIIQKGDSGHWVVQWDFIPPGINPTNAADKLMNMLVFL